VIELAYDQYIDAIFAQFLERWTDGEVDALLGYDTDVAWQGLHASKPDNSKFWVRVSQQTVLERQMTLSDCVGAPGKKRYGTTGLLFVQIFCPIADPRSMELGRKLAIIARSAFRGQSVSNVTFRHARIQEVAPEQELNRFNVVTEYEYSELA
jgi:hypothetical protein